MFIITQKRVDYIVYPYEISYWQSGGTHPASGAFSTLPHWGKGRPGASPPKNKNDKIYTASAIFMLPELFASLDARHGCLAPKNRYPITAMPSLISTTPL